MPPSSVILLQVRSFISILFTVVYTVSDCNLDTWGGEREGSTKGERDANRPTYCV
jgi:hypothetical protein